MTSSTKRIQDIYHPYVEMNGTLLLLSEQKDMDVQIIENTIQISNRLIRH